VRGWLRRFAVRGVFWRQYLDWAVRNLPFYMLPFLIWFWTTFFYFFAAPARSAILANLAIILPGSSRWRNYLRTWRTLYNFAWTITEGSSFKLHKTDFRYEVEGKESLGELAAGSGAIVLTAHMGNYDLGAAIFAEKFRRDIRMVRAPEPDQRTAQHLNESLEKAGAGAVRVDYNVGGGLLSFDLLSALREKEIVSIQGDRVMGDSARERVQLFGHAVELPTGPFILAQVAQVPIFPLFIVRLGYHDYKIIVYPPIVCERSSQDRQQDVAAALRRWAIVLEEVIRQHWNQWYALVPTFVTGEADAA
jgi:lauroyl/myristoyl acyltransferase